MRYFLINFLLIIALFIVLSSLSACAKEDDTLTYFTLVDGTPCVRVGTKAVACNYKQECGE